MLLLTIVRSIRQNIRTAVLTYGPNEMTGFLEDKKLSRKPKTIAHGFTHNSLLFVLFFLLLFEKILGSRNALRSKSRLQDIPCPLLW